MNPAGLIPKNWYWVQKPNGTIVPYRLNRVVTDKGSGAGCRVEMFVGSMIQTFSASQILGEANAPDPSREPSA